MLVSVLNGVVASAQDSETEKGIERYREMVRKDPFANPGLLWVDYGETLWSEKRGPKAVALAASCDLGKGVGKVEGVYAELPRFFADAGRVMDLEARIFWCMTTHQGFEAKALHARKFSPNGAAGEKISDIEALATFAANKSNGLQDQGRSRRRAGEGELRARRSAVQSPHGAVGFLLRLLP